MRLKFEIPFNFNVEGPNSDSLDLKTSFDHKGLIVNVELIGRSPILQPTTSGDTAYVKQITEVGFEIVDNEIADSQLSQLLDDPLNCYQLIKNLLPIINRVLRAIRNLGFISNVFELNPSENKARHLARSWKMQYLTSTGDWKKIVEPSTGILGSIIDSMDPDYQPNYLLTTYWIDIEEAIQDNLKIQPEHEFFTNSIQHIQQRNFRVALIEAIICLEIVLTQFLTVYLSLEKKIPTKRIKKFLTPQFSLSTRICGILDLVLPSEDIKVIELEEVIKAINWRNDIIHKTGNLHENISEIEIRRKIVSVLSLALLLGKKRDHIKNSPMVQELSIMLVEKFKFTEPKIVQVKRHSFIIDFDFLEFELPSDIEQVLNAIATEASSFLTSYDPRFQPEEHLVIRFIDLLKGVKARWKKEKVEIY